MTEENKKSVLDAAISEEETEQALAQTEGEEVTDDEDYEEEAPPLRFTKKGMVTLAATTIVASHVLGPVGGIYTLGTYVTGKTAVALKRLFDQSRCVDEQNFYIAHSKTVKLLGTLGGVGVSLAAGFAVTAAMLYGHVKAEDYLVQSGNWAGHFNKKMVEQLADKGMVLTGVPTVVKAGGKNIVGENGVVAQKDGNTWVLSMQVQSPLTGKVGNPLGSKTVTLKSDAFPDNMLFAKDGLLRAKMSYFEAKNAALSDYGNTDRTAFVGSYLLQKGEEAVKNMYNMAEGMVKKGLNAIEKRFG